MFCSFKNSMQENISEKLVNITEFVIRAFSNKFPHTYGGFYVQVRLSKSAVVSKYSKVASPGVSAHSRTQWKMTKRLVLVFGIITYTNCGFF